MHSQLTTIFKAMEYLLGDVYGGFGYYVVVWYNFMSELVANINGNVLIDTVDVI